MIKFKFLEHKADVKFQAFGNSIEEAFKNSALAMISIFLNSKIKVKNIIDKKIKIQGKDLESLLYNFLEEFLFLLDSEQFLASKITKIKIKKEKSFYTLWAEICGDKSENYEISGDVKAVTYNQMFVKKQGNKFITQVVLDV